MSEGLLRKIALIAGVFSFIISILIIANYIQLQKADPINTQVINQLVERLNQNPEDNQLREQIRTIDLLSRKAYFTNQWQIRMGGYLLLLGIAIILIAFQMISLGRKRVVELNSEPQENITLSQKNARKCINISGGSVFATALLFAFLTHNNLEEKFKEAAIPVKTELSIDSQSEKIAFIESDSGLLEETPQQTKIAKVDSVFKTDSKDIFPTFRGQGGNGKAFQKNIPIKWDGKTGKNIKWKTAIPLNGYNSPIIWGDKIFLTGANATKREVYGIDKNTGKILWNTSVEKIKGSPNEAPKVSEETGYSASTAATDGNGVYAIFANGDLIALDMEGKKKWAQNLGDPQNHYGHSSSLMMYKNLIIIQYDQRNAPKLMAIDANTGKTVWSTPRPVKISWASPIIVNTGNRTEIILAAEPYVSSYNPKNGEELWKVDCISGEVGPSLAYANGMVFSVNDYSKLAAIKLGDKPQVLWESNEYLSDVPSPVATDKYLFIVTSYGTTACCDIHTGEIYWEKEFSNNIYSSPMIAEGKVYLMDRNGIMHIFKADKEFVLIAENALGENSVCTPAFSEGHIFIRGDRNLYCIE